MATNQTWIRPDAAKTSYALERQLQSGDKESQQLVEVLFPAAASLPSTFTGAYYTPRNGAGTEKIIPSGVPFKVGGTWVWSARDTEESTEGLAISYAKRLLVRVDSSISGVVEGQRAYIIPSTGLVTNDANGSTNQLVGTFWSKSADIVVFTSSALSSGEYNGILPDGKYLWIELQGSQAAPAS